jgi:para-aminobenzoate synthetase/4-amino-4-deoxychorismate lyase
MEIIREVEDGARGVYCGAIGFADSDTMAFSVAIRTLTLRGETGVMGTGGGIVWDSEPAAEFDECLLKAKFLTEPPQPMRLIETMRWSDAQGFYLLDRHMARLARSCRYFGFRLDEARVRHLLGKAVAGETGFRRVRLTLGVRGDTQIEHEAFEMPAADTVWQYAIPPSAMNSGDWRVRHKTTQRSIYDEPASLLREALGCDEVLFVNERGELTEGSRTSVFIERDGIWLTPPLDSGLLDGCLRREMLETRPGVVIERVLFPPDLDRGQVWFGNALRGLVRGRSIEDTPASVEA